MGSFLSPLIVEPLPDGIHWKLVKPFTFWYEDETGRYEINVPAGFITDFASVPRLFWVILPPTGRYGKAAVVHDFLYKEGQLPRKQCDKIFLEAMMVLGVSKWKRQIMYWAVRLFGMPFYRKSCYRAVGGK